MCHIELRWLRLLGLVVGVSIVLPGCSTMRGVDALRHVDFELERVTGMRVAGMPIDGVRSPRT